MSGLPSARTGRLACTSLEAAHGLSIGLASDGRTTLLAEGVLSSVSAEHRPLLLRLGLGFSGLFSYVLLLHSGFRLTPLLHPSAWFAVHHPKHVFACLTTPTQLRQ